eukprot:6267332-Prorocentrum_lima.AAC.1
MAMNWEGSCLGDCFLLLPSSTLQAHPASVPTSPASSLHRTCLCIAAAFFAGKACGPSPVSYTHLTLPTICSV